MPDLDPGKLRRYLSRGIRCLVIGHGDPGGHHRLSSQGGESRGDGALDVVRRHDARAASGPSGGRPTAKMVIVPLELAGTYAVRPLGLRTTFRGPWRPLTTREQRSLEVLSRMQAPRPRSCRSTPVAGLRANTPTDWPKYPVAYRRRPLALMVTLSAPLPPWRDRSPSVAQAASPPRELDQLPGGQVAPEACYGAPAAGIRAHVDVPAIRADGHVEGSQQATPDSRAEPLLWAMVSLMHAALPGSWRSAPVAGSREGRYRIAVGRIPRERGIRRVGGHVGVAPVRGEGDRARVVQPDSGGAAAGQPARWSWMQASSPGSWRRPPVSGSRANAAIASLAGDAA